MNVNDQRKKIEQALLAHVANLDGVERIKEIESLIEFLEFERQFAELTPDEKECMYNVMLSELSSGNSQDSTIPRTNEKQRELLTNRARELYQRKQYRFDFLHGYIAVRPPRSSDR